MTALHKEYPIEALAQALEVSPSGYYSHQHKGQGRRAQQDRVLEQHIQKAFQASRATYGSPRIRACLQRQGFHHGKNGALCRAPPKATMISPLRPTGWPKCRHRTGRTRSGWWISPISPPTRGGFIWPSFWTPVRAKLSVGPWVLPWKAPW